MNSAEKYGIKGIRNIIPLFGEWRVFYECQDKMVMIPEQGYGEPVEMSK